LPTSASVDFDTVQVVDVSRHFGRRRAIANVSFEAKSGDILGLLGPNGAGKSTLITMLATLATPSKGEIRYGGESPARLGPGLRTRIGLLAHELHLYPELSAKQNLRFFAELHGLAPHPLIDEALESAGLADRADDAVSSFSRGMRQRLALERSLLHAPRLVLFDVPFSGLDDRAVGLIADRLRRLAANGAIVLLATHDLDMAEGLVNRVALIRNGRLLADEPASPGLRAQYRAIIGAQ
jgi:ABC-type multidrug transport system ATPase subunit